MMVLKEKIGKKGNWFGSPTPGLWIIPLCVAKYLSLLFVLMFQNVVITCLKLFKSSTLIIPAETGT